MVLTVPAEAGLAVGGAAARFGGAGWAGAAAGRGGGTEDALSGSGPLRSPIRASNPPTATCIPTGATSSGLDDGDDVAPLHPGLISHSTRVPSVMSAPSAGIRKSPGINNRAAGIELGQRDR